MKPIKIAIARLLVPLREVKRAVRAYIRRILIWPKILVELKGTTTQDKQVLWLSALLSPILSFRGFDRWGYPVLLSDCTVEAKGIGIFQIRSKTDDLVHCQPSFQKHVVDALKSHLGPGDVFVDVGANVGFFSILAAKLVGSTGMVYAIEMDPENIRQLNRNCEQNQDCEITVINQAASAIAGQIVQAEAPINLYGQGSISGVTRKTSKFRRFDVLTTTLDIVLKDEPRIKFVKVDVEGAELSVFEGARSTLPKVEQIIFESWPGKPEGDAATAYLETSGFEVERISGLDCLAVNTNNPT